MRIDSIRTNRMIAAVAAAFLGTSIVACATRVVLLKNETTGQTVKCGSNARDR